MRLADARYTTMLEKIFDDALSLPNRYAFINHNVLPLLTKEEQELLKEFEAKCLQIESDVRASKNELYPLFPVLGQFYMLQRMNPYRNITGSTRHQLILSLALSQLSPELITIIVPSAVLCSNALVHNPHRTEFQEKALGELIRGEKIGGISITEMANGSDAVNMKVKAEIASDGTITYDGTKIFTTNGAVADYLIAYGVSDISDPRRTMMTTLFQRGDPGLTTERLWIPSLPNGGIGKVQFNHTTVPADRLIAPPGEGYKRLFRGLTPERLSIIGTSMAGLWGCLAVGSIFTQIRYQFGKPLFHNQGISFVLADHYAKIMALTSFAFQIADFYDTKIARKIHANEVPSSLDEGTAALLCSEGKYLLAKQLHDTGYEICQLMGGRGAIDEPGSNNRIAHGADIARIAEVVGGHRNIQLLIIESGLKVMSAMAIDQFVKKAKKENVKTEEEITSLMINNTEQLLERDAGFLSEETKTNLQNVLSKLKAAIAVNNEVEMKAYGEVLPRILTQAGKEAYKAKKAFS